MASRIFGIDLGAYSVKVAIAAPGLRGAVLQDFVEVRVPPGEEPHEIRAARALAEIVRERGLEHDAPYAAIAGDKVFFHVLEFGFKNLKRADLEKAVGAELENVLPIELEEMVYAFEPIRPDAGALAAETSPAFAATSHGRLAPPTDGMRVLCGATQKDRVRGLLETLGEAGAEPRALLAAPAIYPAVLHRLGSEGGPLAVVDLGHERTNVGVLHGGRIDFVRTIARGGRQLTDAIARTFRLPLDQAEAAKQQDGFIASQAEPALSDAWLRIDQALRGELVALARELRQTLATCRAKVGVTVERVLVIGGGSRLRGIVSFLAEELRLPVERLDQADAAVLYGPKLADLDVPADTFCLAAGVAYEGGGGRPTFDLRQGELAFKADLSFLRAKVTQLVAAALVLVAFAAASAYASLYKLRSAETALSQRLATESAAAFGGQSLSASDVLSRIAPGDGEKAAGVLPEMTAYDVLLAFNGALPPPADATIDIDEIDLKPGKVTVRGESSRTGTVEAQDVLKALTTSLKKHRCFADMTDESQPGAEGKRTFTLSIKTECI